MAFGVTMDGVWMGVWMGSESGVWMGSESGVWMGSESGVCGVVWCVVGCKM